MKRLIALALILLPASGGCLRLCFEHEFPQVHLGPAFIAAESDDGDDR